MNEKTIVLSPDLARKLIAEQFPEYSNLPITDVEKQGHDNRTLIHGFVHVPGHCGKRHSNYAKFQIRIALKLKCRN